MFEIFILALIVALLVVHSKFAKLEDKFSVLERKFIELAEQINASSSSKAPKKQKKSAPSKKVKPIEEPEDDAEAESVWSKSAAQKTAAAQATTDSVSSKSSKKSDEGGRKWADFEKRIGEQWSVIAGGLAMAFGAVFLVKYSIDAGLLGPVQRITFGLLVSAGLLGGGEWLRRHDKKLSLAIVPNADIPGVLTAAGIVGAFAAIYAGYALYDLFSPAIAFIALTIVGLGALVLSSLHGPKLAAIGALGAYGVPALISSDQPNMLILALHVLVVSASVLAIARIREWLWLIMAGLAGAAGWTVLAATSSAYLSGVGGAVLVVGSAILFIGVFLPEKINWKIAPADQKNNRYAVLSCFVLLGAFLVQLALNAQLPVVLVGAVVGALFMGAAICFSGLKWLSAFSAIFTVLAISRIDLNLVEMAASFTPSDLANNLVPPDINAYLLQAAMLGILPVVLGYFGSFRVATSAPVLAGYVASSVGAILFFSLLVAYLRISPFEMSNLFGVIAIVLALICAVSVEKFTCERPDDFSAVAPAAFAVSSVALLSFAIGVLISKSWLPLGFALSGLGVAYIFTKREVKALPWLSCVSVILAGIALWFSVPFHGIEIGKTPLFNDLILLLGLPSLAMLLSGEILRREGEHYPFTIIQTIGLAGSALFIALQLRHWINGGEIFAGHFGLADMATQAIAALGFSIGLQKIAQRSQIKFYDTASYIVGTMSLLVLFLGLVVVFNPYLTNDGVGERRFANLLLPAYLITGIMATIVALYARPSRARSYTLGYAALAGVLFFLFASSTTRHVFQGSNIGFFKHTTDLEFWMYSVVWLAMGAATLAVGLWLKSQPVRIAAVLLIVLTVLKVFILDMAALTGVLRALSFLGLGAFLIVVGRYYQRILIAKK